MTVTSREAFDAARNLEPHVDALNKLYEQAVIAHAEVKDAYEKAEASAFLKASDEGASVAKAERIARLDEDVAALKADMGRLDAEMRAAKHGSAQWQGVMETYQAVSHLANRELKSFAGSNS